MLSVPGIGDLDKDTTLVPVVHNGITAVKVYCKLLESYRKLDGV